MKIIRFGCYSLVSIGLLLAGLYGYFVYAPAAPLPVLTGQLQSAQLQVGGLQRQYSVYLPAKPVQHPALLLVLHGSLQTSEDIRTFSGYEFERLADANGFIVVYPQGFKNNWNDCRRSANYPARAQNIDDLGFMQGLIEKLVQEHGIDRQRVFLTGYSNGAHLGFRIALEQPDMLNAVAAVSANLPTPDNLECRESGKPVSMLIMNGTADPMNPYAGGKVALYGLGNRGTVLSSLETAWYFASLAGYERAAVSSVVWSQKAPFEKVTLEQWQHATAPEVNLYSLEEGGHMLPQPYFRAPRILGKTTSGFNGPETIWAFFSRQPARPVLP